MIRFKVRYLGKDGVDIRHGDVYEAEELIDSATMYGVVDRTGDLYAYPRELFEIIEEIKPAEE